VACDFAMIRVHHAERHNSGEAICLDLEHVAAVLQPLPTLL